LFFAEPAGAYHEIAYFVPLAITFARDHVDEADEFIGGLIAAVAKWHDLFERDNILDDFVLSLGDVFSQWTSDFVPLVRNLKDLAPNSESPHVALGARNQESVFDFLDAVTDSESMLDLVSPVTQALCDGGSVWQRTAWLLEYNVALMSGMQKVGQWNSDGVCIGRVADKIREVAPHLPAECAERFTQRWSALQNRND
jgi:hypothetical protein